VTAPPPPGVATHDVLMSVLAERRRRSSHPGDGGGIAARRGRLWAAVRVEKQEVIVSEISVHDNPAASRYEAYVDGALAGFAAYSGQPGRVVFTHTETDPEFAGQGVGGALARFALDDVRARGLQATPLCPFIAAYIGKHPEYVDLVDEAHRGQYTR
jgi:uncharacterized protein